MKVKIGNRIIDAEDEPIMVILSDKDKCNIANMDPESDKYCCVPDDTPISVIYHFMHDDI